MTQTIEESVSVGTGIAFVSLEASSAHRASSSSRSIGSAVSYGRMTHGILTSVSLGAGIAFDSFVAFQADFAIASDCRLGVAVGDCGVTQVVGRSCLARFAGGTAP